MKIELIPAQTADLDEVCALCRDVAARTPSSGWDDHYPNRDFLSHDIAVRSLYKVPDEAGRIVSIMQIRSWEDYARGEETETHGWSEDILNPCALGRFCVSPDLQGRGLGRRIMEATLSKARAMGFDGARFHAVATNAVALHLYDKMGFRRVEQIHEYGLDFISYEIHL